ncbi:hypothetical protein [Flavobacterium sp. B183]|uniref:hypothetical protein n=1 Tax=Flavobacterium sp. B183 TaxID=907046 RepID=UPI00201F2243|nr:hypothetical protein [Flavobacterium sp. B183]URC13412.1 hypothetical protein M4I44_03185 [Flavobacterium sp. B183]
MKKHLKYLIALFLTFVVIAGDGTLCAPSKSAEYYQSSFVVSRTELDLKNFRSYQFGRITSRVKSVFSIVLDFLSVENVLSFQNKIVFKLQQKLHQNLTSFIKQSVFVNEMMTSGNFRGSLDII